MSASADLAPQCQVEHCITCGDEAAPMRVRALDRERGLALCELADGRRETVETALVDGVAVDETVLVHAGVALQRAPEPLAGTDDGGLDPGFQPIRVMSAGVASREVVGAGAESRKVVSAVTEGAA